ncbi:MAG TPA: hypothetical protein VIW24_18340 [Aldersonia sp.]
MSISTIARRAAVAGALATAALTSTATLCTAAATATTPEIAGIASLQDQIGDAPDARAALQALADAARVSAQGNYATFAWPSPTTGCGLEGPLTITGASGIGGAVGSHVLPGQVRFSAAPRYVGIPTESGLQVGWLNVNTGANGVVAMDEMTEFGSPALAKTVDTGPGYVLAAMWGTIGFADATCSLTPTVGLFLSDAPPPPPPPPPA